MNAFLWSVQGLLAALFLGAGAVKSIRPLHTLRSSLGGWVDEVPMPLIRLVGSLEIAAAVGLVVPPAIGIGAWLAPTAAGGLTLVMTGAAFVHGRRGETSSVIQNVVLALVSAALCWTRFGPYPFH